MTTVYGWTGREARLLRKALRLSVRDFAAHLGVGTRTVNKWEARQAGITPLPYMQEVLDTALGRAGDEVKARFAAAARGEVTGPAPELLAAREVMMPVVVDGQVVLVPVDGDTVADSGLRVLRNEPARFEAGSAYPDGGRSPGHAFGVTVGSSEAAARKGASWVDRRDFGEHVAGLLIAAGVFGLDIDRLLALLPQAEPTGTRHIGTADVDLIESATDTFRRQDFAHGSGLTRDAAVAQLRAALPLLGAEVDDDLRPRLMVATAHLAMMTGWMSFQVKQHDAARRLWLIGLDIARAAEHPLGGDLTAYLVFDMALQAIHLQRPDEALHLVQLGQAAATGSRPVSASTISSLTNVQARAHAARGDVTACDRALGRAEEQFSRIDPATRPPWGGHLDEAGIASHRGAAHYALARTGGDRGDADRAVPLLRHVVDHRGPDYAVLRAQKLPELAGAHALAGDADAAVSVGHQAVDAIAAVSSPRAYDGLGTLHAVLQPLHTSPDVADLRDRLVATAA